jgi:hypothetical protein
MTEAVRRPAETGQRPVKAVAASNPAAKGTAKSGQRERAEAHERVLRGTEAHERALRGQEARERAAPANDRRTKDRRRLIAKVAPKRSARRDGKPVRTPAGKPAREPERVVRIRELAPQDLCGKRTSVLQLFRVDEQVDGDAQTHLVFYDRHGWYCYHGATCPVVGEVRKVANV